MQYACETSTLNEAEKGREHFNFSLPLFVCVLLLLGYIRLLTEDQLEYESA